MHLAQQRDGQVDLGALQHRAPERQRGEAGGGGEEQAGAHQHAGIDRRRLVELVAAAREIADHQRQAR